MTQEATKTATYCYNHPDRETYLRCNRCERPICTSCAILTETGYRCKECVRGQQKAFDTAQWYDYPLAFIVGGGLAYLGSMLATVLGFFTIFLAPVIGVAIAESIRWSVRRRRSRLLFRVATIGIVVGALLIPLSILLTGLMFGGNVSLFRLLWPGVYIFLVVSTAYYRLSGIQLR
jgi:hypothetical protein